MAKPVKINVHKVIADFEKGMSITKACQIQKVSTASFYKIVDNNEELKNELAHARENRGDLCLDVIETIQQKLADGKIDANTARVLIDTEKWKATKFYPRLYGDKSEQNITTTVNILPSVKINGKEKDFDVG